MSITMPWNHGLLCRGPKAEAILTSPAASRATNYQSRIPTNTLHAFPVNLRGAKRDTGISPGPRFPTQPPAKPDKAKPQPPSTMPNM
jgi:hypothetical protein